MDSLMLKPKTELSARPQGGSGLFKSVVLHVQDDPGLEGRLQAALGIVRASGGHLSCVQATPMPPFAGYTDYGSATVLTNLMQEIGERDAALRERIEARLSKEDVAWSYEQQAWDNTVTLIQAGALADLIVLGRFEHSRVITRKSLALFGDLLATSRTPLLIYPDEAADFDPFGTAVVAWNSSLEAAAALKAALPLLLQAASVHVVTVDEPGNLDFPPLDVAEYLSRHGIHAEMIDEHAGTLSIADRLIATAASLGASYLVAGGYGHSRAREYLFGGVTRSLLQECSLALIISR